MLQPLDSEETTCRTEDLTGLAAGDLNPLKAFQVRRHLSSCAECRAEWESVQSQWTSASGLRSVAPPDTLVPRLSAWLPPATAPRRSVAWKPLTALGAGAAVAAAVVFLSPGSVTRPSPALAAVEEAMQKAGSASWTETRISYGTLGQAPLRQVQQVWVRRTPAAIATLTAPTFALGPQKTLKDAGGKITLKLGNGEYIRSRHVRQSAAEEVTDKLRSLTELPADMDSLPGSTATAWIETPGQWAGHSARHFTRSVHSHVVIPARTSLPFHLIMVDAKQSVWVDAATSYVLQSETQEAIDGTQAIDEIKSDLHYGETAPAGVFTLTPPAGAKVVER